MIGLETLCGVVVLLTGFAVSLVEVILFIVIRPFSLRIFRLINAHVVTSFWHVVIFLAEWLSRTEVTCFFDNPDDAKSMAEDHKVLLGNHSSDIDWLLGWLVAARFNTLKGTKALMKKSLLLVPGLGWSWWLSDYIFLSRDWKKDQAHLDKNIKTFVDYPVPLCLMIYAEGTRATPAKLAKSREYCIKSGIEPMKHLMYPRTKGWVAVMKELQNAVDSVILFTLAFPDFEPTGRTLLSGKPFRTHVHFRRIPIADVPKTPEGLQTWCVDAYKQMDAIVDHHKVHNTFPGTIVETKRCVKSLVATVFWVTVWLGSLAYYLLTRANPLLATAIVAASYIALGMFIQLNVKKNAKKASSSAGAKKNA